MFFSPQLDGWVVTRYAECDAILRDSHAYESALDRASGRVGEHARAVRRGSPLHGLGVLGQLDGPEHARLREPVARVFSRVAVEAHRSALTALCDSLVESLPATQPFDFVALVGGQLPSRAVGLVIGLREDPLLVQHHCQAVMDAASSLASRPQRDSAVESLGWLRERLADGRLVADEVLAGAQDDEERVALAAFVMNAGAGPLAALLANGLVALAAEPRVAESLRAAPDLIPDAVEELLRYESPLQYTTRVSARDQRLRGSEIRSGDSVFVMLGGANHDPDVFEEPDALDHRRGDASRHLAYGRGPHFCLGAPFASLVASLFFRAFLARYRRFEVSREGSSRLSSPLLRGFGALTVSGNAT